MKKPLKPGGGVWGSPSVRIHLIILGMSLTITLCVWSASLQRYDAERHQVEAAGRARRITEIATGWNALNFTEISQPAVAKQLFLRVDSQKLPLSQVQRDRLEVRLKEILEYLCRPSFETYLDLKTHGLHYRVTKTLGAKHIRGLAELPPESDNESFARSLWNSAAGRTNVDPHAHLTSIGLETVRAAIAHTNSPASVFGGAVWQGFTVACAGGDTGFRYGDGSNRTEAPASTGPFTLLSFLAHSSSSTNAAPIYLSLFWSEVDQNWAFNRLFTDMLLKFEPPF